jgi:hypothetical protein
MGGDSTYFFAPPGAAPQPAHHRRAAGLARYLRARDRRRFDARVPLLRPRGLRRVLPRLRRDLAAPARVDRHDLRAGVGARPRLPPGGRHAAHVPRRHPQPLPGRARHGGHRRARAREAAARLPRVPALRGRRGRGRARCALRARPGPDPARCPGSPPAPRRGRGSRCSVAAGELRAGGRTLPAGAIVVPLAQGAGRLVRNLLDPRVPMDEGFREGAGAAAEQAPARRDLRRDRVEPAAAVRRGVHGRDRAGRETRSVDAADRGRGARPRGGQGGVAAALGLGYGGGGARGGAGGPQGAGGGRRPARSAAGRFPPGRRSSGSRRTPPAPARPSGGSRARTRPRRWRWTPGSWRRACRSAAAACAC